MTPDNTSMHCRRPSGSFRAWFASYDEARLFAVDPENIDYHGDVPVKCRQHGCGGWHLSQPWWPDAVAERN
jgi:hypothetical protein